MATFIHGAPEVQPDGLQTLFLMNPGYAGYMDAAAPANMVLLNSTMNSLNPIILAQAGQPNHQQQDFVGIPLQTAARLRDSDRPLPIHASHDASVLPRLHHNLWTPTPTSNSVDVASQFSPRRRGLSLSLSPHEMAMTPASAHEVKFAASAGGANGVSGRRSFLMGSKYLKAAQQLLDEVVDVGKGIKDEAAKGPKSRNTELKGEETTSTKQRADLTTAERQELQMKKAKLISMLEEAEQRYRKYNHQMQTVIASFEAVAGHGSARTYTVLAQRTISKQFRCLRDAIVGQIRATCKTLGEEDTKLGNSRLRFIDQHLRQQRQMIQPNAWRPQRGLPERSVSVLRAWLFEHFLHPYPTDSDKFMLAKQTGLTRSQVSNWFINARVRLWKPMVEEIYLEETKHHEQRNADETATKIDANGRSTSKSSTGMTDSLKNDVKQPSAAAQPPPPPPPFEPKLDALSNQELLMKFMDARQMIEEQAYPLIAGSSSQGGDHEAYPTFASRFSGSGVSLTLGLQHSGNLSLSGAQPSIPSSESIWAGGWR
ncbi:BEL1-like homeodomain protein 1 [Musa acuminata AAA Group]|uniref:BEL1-like homeodomain protein 1 n=1 Tax=Musa acuminata AAA Group TaxID=214697 RepID=UPI0031D9D1F6